MDQQIALSCIIHQLLAGNSITGNHDHTVLGLKAEALIALGRVDEGVETLARAIDISEKHSLRFYLAELYRLKGELLLTLSKDRFKNAARCFQQSLDIARGQQAKSLELRTAMSLMRIRQHRGQEEDAYEEFKKVYDWFSEGFDTYDLHEAKALTDTLH